MANQLQGKKVAILIAPVGTEQVEFTQPRDAAREAGAEVDVIGFEAGKAQTMQHDVDKGETFPVDKVVTDVSADDYDAVIVPGGCVGADRLRGNADIVAFVHRFFEQEKPVAVICHGPWVLVEADVVRGRTLTSYPTLQTDIRNAGGNWVDREVVTDKGLVTSRNPKDLPAFCKKLVEEFAEGRHPAQARSVA
jgi:protease I